MLEAQCKNMVPASDEAVLSNGRRHHIAREREWLISLHLVTPCAHHGDPTFMISAYVNYRLIPNIINTNLGIKCPTHEF